MDITGDVDLNDFSCVSFREIKPYEYSNEDFDLYITSDGSADYGTYSLDSSDNDWGVEYENVFLFDSEFLDDANGVNFQTYIYAEPYDWGFNLMPNQYDFRVPQLMQQCGTYARNSRFEGYSTFQLYDGTVNKFSGEELEQYVDYGDHFVQLTLG